MKVKPLTPYHRVCTGNQCQDSVADESVQVDGALSKACMWTKCSTLTPDHGVCTGNRCQESVGKGGRGQRLWHPLLLTAFHHGPYSASDESVHVGEALSGFICELRLHTVAATWRVKSLTPNHRVCAGNQCQEREVIAHT